MDVCSIRNSNVDIAFKVDINAPLEGNVLDDSYLFDWLADKDNPLFIYTGRRFIGYGVPAGQLTYFTPEKHINTFDGLGYTMMLEDKSTKEKINKLIQQVKCTKRKLKTRPKELIWSLDGLPMRDVVKKKLQKEFDPIVKSKFRQCSDDTVFSVMMFYDDIIFRMNQLRVKKDTLRLQFCVVNLYYLARMSPVFCIMGGVHHDDNREYISCFMQGIGESIDNLDYIKKKKYDRLQFVFELYLALSLLERDGFELDLEDIKDDPYILTCYKEKKTRIYATDEFVYEIKSHWRPALCTAFRLRCGKRTAEETLILLGFEDKLNFNSLTITPDRIKELSSNDTEMYYFLSDMTEYAVYPSYINPSEEIHSQVEELSKIPFEKTQPYRLLCGEDYSAVNDDFKVNTSLNYISYNKDIVVVPAIKINLLFTWNHGPSQASDEFFYGDGRVEEGRYGDESFEHRKQ